VLNSFLFQPHSYRCWLAQDMAFPLGQMRIIRSLASSKAYLFVIEPTS
jgi:hypothetical protein